MLAISFLVAFLSVLVPPYLCPWLDLSGDGNPMVTVCRITAQLTTQKRQAFFKSNLQELQGTWNILYHLGGNGPWIPKADGVVGGGIDVPEACRLDQVVMMSRHAESYPTVRAGIRMLELFHRIQKANLTLNGDLAFATDWDFFVPNPSANFENLVPTGPYAGTFEAFSTGVMLRTRYTHLREQALKTGKTTLWASGSERVESSARYFAAGFFGLDWQEVATLQVIPETSDLGVNTLSPGNTCLSYANKADEYGHEYGARMLEAFRSTYLPAISKRLAEQNPNMTFGEDEVFTMQEMCGFETIAKGSSPWCEVFTHDEWESFEYARDVQHFFRTGPGNPYGATMGWPWLNATARLFAEGPEAGGLFFSFVHDGDVISLLAALDLFPQDPPLSTSHIMPNGTWRTSHVVPMGGRIIFERLSRPAPQNCWSNEPLYPNHIYCNPPHDDIFVRVNVNDGIVAIAGCDSGPGESCPLETFLDLVKKQGEKAGNFGTLCGLPETAPERITFLHQRLAKPRSLSSDV